LIAVPTGVKFFNWIGTMWRGSLCVLLAGEVGHAGGDALAARVEERLTLMSPLRTEVRAGRLGGAAVLRGALLAAREAAQDELFTPAG
ncbi:hypothetical protein AB0Q93_27605, partial [Streptomyces sp. NPDC088184]